MIFFVEPLWTLQLSHHPGTLSRGWPRRPSTCSATAWHHSFRLRGHPGGKSCVAITDLENKRSGRCSCFDRWWTFFFDKKPIVSDFFHRCQNTCDSFVRQWGIQFFHVLLISAVTLFAEHPHDVRMEWSGFSLVVKFQIFHEAAWYSLPDIRMIHGSNNLLVVENHSKCNQVNNVQKHSFFLSFFLLVHFTWSIYPCLDTSCVPILGWLPEWTMFWCKRVETVWSSVSLQQPWGSGNRYATALSYYRPVKERGVDVWYVLRTLDTFLRVYFQEVLESFHSHWQQISHQNFTKKKRNSFPAHGRNPVYQQLGPEEKRLTKNTEKLFFDGVGDVPQDPPRMMTMSWTRNLWLVGFFLRSMVDVVPRDDDSDEPGSLWSFWGSVLGLDYLAGWGSAWRVSWTSSYSPTPGETKRNRWLLHFCLGDFARNGQIFRLDGVFNTTARTLEDNDLPPRQWDFWELGQIAKKYQKMDGLGNVAKGRNFQWLWPNIWWPAAAPATVLWLETMLTWSWSANIPRYLRSKLLGP